MEIIKEANLDIFFCWHREQSNSYYRFDTMKINDDSYSINKNIKTKIPFTNLELILGKKVCTFELMNKKEGTYEKGPVGTFQIYLGDNTAYCFIDNSGVTLELVFLEENNNNKNIINKKFEISIDPNISEKKIKITPNNLNTGNRANLILINCDSSIVLLNSPNKRWKRFLFCQYSSTHRAIASFCQAGSSICWGHCRYDYRCVWEHRNSTLGDIHSATIIAMLTCCFTFLSTCRFDSRIIHWFLMHKDFFNCDNRCRSMYKRSTFWNNDFFDIDKSVFTYADDTGRHCNTV